MSGICVTVAYAADTGQVIATVIVPAGSRVHDALESSGFRIQYPKIDLQNHRVGIFGRLAGLNTPLIAGDRIEIYRPLRADPKDSRRRRVRRHPNPSHPG